MRDFILLFGFYFTQFKNKMLKPKKEDIFKFFVLLFFALVFFPMIYQLFYFIFKHFYAAPIVGGLLVNRLLSAIYMSFSFMILMSAVVSAIPVLYLSRDMDFLFSSPVKTETVFAFQYFKIIYEASWMILMMAVPIFAAYSTVLKVNAASFAAIIIAHVPFFFVMASAGVILTLALVRWFPAENIRNIAIAISGIFLMTMVLYFRMLEPEKLSGASLNDVTSFLNSLRTPDTPFLPHTHFVGLIRDITAKGMLNATGPFLIQICAAFVTAALTLKSAQLWYFDGYGRKGIHRKEKPLSPSYRFAKRNIFAAQINKDIKYMARDTSQWIQVVFLFGVVVIYLFNIYKLPSDLFNLKNIIYFLNIGFIGFVMAAIGSRFILPVISIEGRAFWIYKSAPVTMTKYIINKFLAYGIPVMITGILVALISIKILRSDEYINFVTLFSTVCVTLVISAVGTGFGGLFANFTIKNPEEMITGAAGLTYMFVTMVFIGIMLAFIATPVRQYYMTSMVKAMVFNPKDYIWFFAAAAFLAAVISVISLWAGIKKLEKMEI